LESNTAFTPAGPHPSPLPEEKGINAPRLALFATLWLIAIAIAACLDARVASFMRSSGTSGYLENHKAISETIKTAGFYPFTLLVVIPIVAWKHRAKWLAALFVLIATLLAGSNQLFKWIAGRSRPFKPPDGSGALVPFELHPFPSSGKNLCFPSGHACLAFATAAALGILWPRFRWGFYALATIVAVERFAENAHWLSDCVAAAALGIAGAHLVRWIWWRTVEQKL
jgi:membrane-associated phospholipid phosphatase